MIQRILGLVVVFLLTLSLGVARAAFQYSTDFDELDHSFWLVFSQVTENGVLFFHV